MGPKVSKGRSESPLVAPAGAKSFMLARIQYETCKNNEAAYFDNGLTEAKAIQTVDKGTPFYMDARKMKLPAS